MGRKRREESISGYYHVTQRGISKEDIFLSDNDRAKFCKLLAEQVGSGLKIHCYCLMGNHIHIIVWSENKDVLSYKMKSLFMSYTIYFNNTYDRDGPLYKNRFWSRPIETKDYFKRCVRYILRNPIDVGCRMFYNYQWSSIKCYFSYRRSNSHFDATIVSLNNLVSVKEIEGYFNNSFTSFTAYIGKAKDDREDEKEYPFYSRKRVKNTVSKDRRKIYTHIKEVYNIHDPQRLTLEERITIGVSVIKSLPDMPKKRICECVGISYPTLKKYFSLRGQVHSEKL